MKSLYKLALTTAALVSLSSTSGLATVYIWQDNQVVPYQPGVTVNYQTVTTNFPNATIYEWPGEVARFTVGTAAAVGTVLTAPVTFATGTNYIIVP